MWRFFFITVQLAFNFERLFEKKPFSAVNLVLFEWILFFFFYIQTFDARINS